MIERSLFAFDEIMTNTKGLKLEEVNMEVASIKSNQFYRSLMSPSVPEQG